MADRRVVMQPRVLSAIDAAAYLSVSVTLFRQEIVPNIRTVPLSAKRLGYLREDLDRWVDFRAGITNTPTLKSGWDAFR